MPENGNRPPFGPRLGGGGHRKIGMKQDKPKDFKKTLKHLLMYLRPRKFILLLVFFLTILSSGFNVLGPMVMGMATTKLFEGFTEKLKGDTGDGFDFTGIRNILIILTLLYIASAIFNFVMRYLMAKVAQETVYELRQDVNRKLRHLPLAYFDGRSHGEILSRVTNDVDNIANTLQQSLTQMISSVVMFIGVIIMMLWINPLLTLITMLTLPLSLVLIAQVTKRSQPYFVRQQRILGELNGHVEEMYTGHRIIKAFNKEKDAIEKFQVQNMEFYEVGWKARFISGVIQPLMQVVNNIGYVLVCVFGGIFVTQGFITVGQVQAFIQYARQFGQPLIQTANISNLIQSTIASAERVFDILEEKEEIADVNNPIDFEHIQGNVIFKDVKFGYKTSEPPLMSSVSFQVEPGQKVAIVGPTGAGKTTLVNLLMRFYELWSGEIIIDHIGTTKLSRKDLRSIFGMVLQDTWLFKGTIRENIAYGKEDASEQEIIDAAKMARADHFIRTLPQGYDTILNEEANNISQGQKQLLTIARALLANPPMMILDEATSSVDTRTEINIQKAMEVMTQGRTSFVIAHRLTTIKDSDLILVMNHGTIIESGTHESLLESNGFYEELYNSQFTGRYSVDSE